MSKIKWNDDRLRLTLTALLLISRDRLGQGLTTNLIAEALAAYRSDPAAYKKAHWNKEKNAWDNPADLGPLANSKHAADYTRLLARVDALTLRFKQKQIQFSSLIELDHYLVTYLKSPS